MSVSDTPDPISAKSTSFFPLDTPWKPLSATLVTICLCASIFLVLPVFYFIGFLVFDLGLSPDATQTDAKFKELFEGLHFLTFLFFVQIILAFAFYILAGFYCGDRRNVLFLNRPEMNFMSLFLLVLGFCVVTLLLGYSINLVFSYDMKKILSDSYPEMFKSELFFYAFINAVIAAPLWEEIVFRGFLLSSFARSRNLFIFGAVFSSLIWSLLHWLYPWPFLVLIFIMGLFFSYLIFKTRSLWTVIACHGVYNFSCIMISQLFYAT